MLKCHIKLELPVVWTEGQGQSACSILTSDEKHEIGNTFFFFFSQQ